MKIRITDPGFAGFTGHLGTAYFVDGVCEDVSPVEAERMASILSFEEVDTGANPSVTQRMVDLVNKNADEMGINSDAVLVKAMEPLPKPDTISVQPEVIVQLPSLTGITYNYSREQLEALADVEGIAGLRAFADVYKVNGKSIKGIITDLMDLKGLHNKPAQEQALAAQTDADIVSTHVVEHEDSKGNVFTTIEPKIEERPAPNEHPVRDILVPAEAPLVESPDEDLVPDLDEAFKEESPKTFSETTDNAAKADPNVESTDEQVGSTVGAVSDEDAGDVEAQAVAKAEAEAKAKAEAEAEAEATAKSEAEAKKDAAAKAKAKVKAKKDAEAAQE